MKHTWHRWSCYVLCSFAVIYSYSVNIGETDNLVIVKYCLFVKQIKMRAVINRILRGRWMRSRFHLSPSKRCLNISPRATVVYLMVVMINTQTYYIQTFKSIHAVIDELFQSGPKWWTDRHTVQALIPRTILLA